MDYNTIKKLLEKYWDGNSSMAEEQRLRDYFNEEEVLAELEAYRPLFVYFNEEQTLQLDADFESRLKQQTQPDEKVIPKRQALRFYLGRIAAAAVFAFGVFFLYQQQQDIRQLQAVVWEDTYDDPKEAYAKTKEMLMLVSSQINKGTNKAAASVKRGQKATARIVTIND